VEPAWPADAAGAAAELNRAPPADNKRRGGGRGRGSNMDGGEQISGPQAKGRQPEKAKTKRASVTKRLIIMLLAVGLVLGAVFGFQVFKSHMIAQAIAAMANPPQTVSTTVAAQAEWQDRLEAVGSLRAVN